MVWGRFADTLQVGEVPAIGARRWWETMALGEALELTELLAADIRLPLSFVEGRRHGNWGIARYLQQGAAFMVTLPDLVR